MQRRQQGRGKLDKEREAKLDALSDLGLFVWKFFPRFDDTSLEKVTQAAGGGGSAFSMMLPDAPASNNNVSSSSTSSSSFSKTDNVEAWDGAGDPDGDVVISMGLSERRVDNSSSSSSSSSSISKKGDDLSDSDSGNILVQTSRGDRTSSGGGRDTSSGSAKATFFRDCLLSNTESAKRYLKPPSVTHITYLRTHTYTNTHSNLPHH
jgi:hypothetical protein